jgi:hypothetical protein
MNSEQLLSYLEERTRRLPADLREGLLEEMRAHLDASIQARMELGSSWEEASAQAAAEFGPPRLIARKLNVVHLPLAIDRPFAVSVFSFVAVFALQLALNWNMILPDDVAALPLTLMLLIFLPLILVTAYRARRWQWKTLLVLYPVASILFALAGASAYAPDTLPPAMGTNYRQAAQWAQDHLRKAERLDAQAKGLEQLRERFNAGENVAPSLGPNPNGTEGRVLANRAAVEKAWKRFSDPRVEALWERAEAKRLLALNQALWWKGIPYKLVGMQPLAGPWALIVAALSLMAAVTAQLIDRICRRLRKT